MKNHIITFLLSLLVAGGAVAQDFAPVGAKWHYDNWGAITFFGDGYITLENQGDTLIEDKVCQRLLKTTYTYNGLTENNHIATSFEYVTSQGDSVFNYRFGQFYLLYDFAAMPGDSWTVAGNSTCEQPGTVIVDSIAFESIDGDQFRSLYVSSPMESPVQFSRGTIYERIGCVGYMFPEPMCMLDGDQGGPLRCYADNAASYQFRNDLECDEITLVGIADHDDAPFTVGPTMFTDIISIQGPSSALIYQLIDLQGRIVQKGEVLSPSDLPLGHVASGPYILHLSSRSYSASFRLLRSN